MRAIVLGFVMVLASAAIARADSTAVIVGGKSDAHAQAIAERAITDALHNAGWTLLDAPLANTETTAIAQCFKDPDPPSCVMRRVHDRGVGRVVFVLVDPDPSSAGLQISARLVAANVGSVLAAPQFCDHCTDDTLARAAGEAMRMLVQRLALETGRAVLSVKSTPQGARFSVDGSFAGATDQSIDIAPGAHLIRIEHDGFDAATRNISAVEGGTSEIVVTLHRTGAPESDGSTSGTNHRNSGSSTMQHDSSPTHHSLVMPIALVTVGGAAVISGAIALAYNESIPTSPRGTTQQQYYYDTTAPGYAAIIGGVAVAAVGGYLWWHYAHANAAPSVAVVAGGAVVTVTGAF